MNDNKIEQERWDMAKIMADNFHINGEGWDDSDFEWTAHCLKEAGYHKQSKGKWRLTAETLGRHDVPCIECSVCGDSWALDGDFDFESALDYWHYCPTCGAQMKGGNDMTDRERLIELLKTISNEPIMLDGLSEWADEIADRLLANGVIVPPCKVGDVVYTNISGTTLHNSFRINQIDLLGFSNGIYSWTWHQLGKSVFLSIEEAERMEK